MRNTGKSYEAEFERYWAHKGKSCFLHRVTDAAEVRGRSAPEARVHARVPKQPSDYLLTEDGRMQYAEVKSCSNITSFPFSQIEDGQWSAAVKQTVAGGPYDFFIYAVSRMMWYRVPAAVILAAKKQGRSSLKWNELDVYIWIEMMEFINVA